MQTFVWAVVGSAILILLYQHIRINWPESYFGPRESLAHYFSSGGLRFAVFRFAPPFLVFLLVGIYAADPTYAIIVTAVVYVLESTALSVRSSMRHEVGSVALTGQRIAVLAFVAIGLGASAALAALLAPIASPTFPSVGDVAANLVAALIAAVLAVSYFQGTTEMSDRTDLPEDLTAQIRALALENCVDQRLALAIAYVENTQRPPWFRKIENLSARFNKRGSFGLFQVSGHGALDDVESCRVAMESLKGTYPLIDEYGEGVDWSVRAGAEKHNPDNRFAEMVAEAYMYLGSHALARADGDAPDGRPLLEVCQVGRFGDRMRIRGTFWAPTEEVAVELIGDEAVPQPLEVSVNACSGRSSWSADVPAGARRVLVRSVSELEGCFTSADVAVDLRRVPVDRDLTLKGRRAPAPSEAQF